MDNTFRAIALALRPYISDSYQLLNAADAVVQVTYGLFPDKDALRVQECTPELIRYATLNATILNHMSGPDVQKIRAIKELRTQTSCGLKAAKDAVESSDFALALLRYKLTGEVR